jgi:cytoplasmic iron level regulating protein YaaA (DUF328/UPF0246 family)
MKIILSPSKTQNDQGFSHISNKYPLNQEMTFDLFHRMKGFSKKSMGEAMKIQGKCLDETYEYYQNFYPENFMLQAIDCYQGVVFHEIKTNQYNEKQRSYMNHHLVILSAMYGVLEPDTQIWPYRLDMKVKLEGIHLYKYWEKQIDTYFFKEDLIINLASDEFSRLLKPFEKRMLHIHFLEKKKDGRLKVISVNAKKARGIMAHQMILYQIQDIQRIREFDIIGYRFDQELSDDTNYFFVK